MKKRILSMLLMLCMVVSLLPSTALAAEEDTAETPDQEQCAQLPGCGEEVHDVGCPLYTVPEGDEENVQSTPASEPSAQEEPAAEQDGVYSVATAEDFSKAITAIEQAEQTEAIIVLDADLTGNNSVKTFQGVENKKITITSAEGATHALHIPDECILKGDVSLDRVKLSASDYTGIYACGHTFETTADFVGKINAVYGGGPKGQDIEGGTNIVLRGGTVTYLHGGGHDSAVNGNVSILIDGSNVHIGSLYGGGHAKETTSGTVSGNVTVNMRHGTNGLFFGGGHNEYSKADNEGDRDPASVSGTVTVTFGYDGAPDKSVCPGKSMFTYAGSYHSTVGNVVLNVTDGFTTEDQLGDRNLFGCGYNDTVLGTVEIHVYGKPDIGNGHIYGGGSTENPLGESWPVRILNQAHKEHALYVTYDVPSEMNAAAAHHGINAGSDDSIPMTIHGNVLVELKSGNMDFIVMDNEDFGENSCAIEGTCTLRIAGDSTIAQIQGNYKHFKENGGAGASGDRVIYDGCGTADAPQLSGYLHGFGEVVLQNNANVLVSGKATQAFESTQKPFYSVYGLTVEEGSVLKTTDAQAHIYGNTVVNGVWEQAYKKAADYNDLWVKGKLTVGSKGQLISLGTTNIKGDVTSQGTIALMSPALFQENYLGTYAELRLPAVADGRNYDGTEIGGDIPLHIEGRAWWSTTVYTVSPTDWQTLQTPKLGDNYITGGKHDGATPAQDVFLLGNADALSQGLYLKRVDDPFVSESGSQDFMWQVANWPDKNESGVTFHFVTYGGMPEADDIFIPWSRFVDSGFDLRGIPVVENPSLDGFEFLWWSFDATAQLNWAMNSPNEEIRSEVAPSYQEKWDEFIQLRKAEAQRLRDVLTNGTPEEIAEAFDITGTPFKTPEEYAPVLINYYENVLESKLPVCGRYEQQQKYDYDMVVQDGYNCLIQKTKQFKYLPQERQCVPVLSIANMTSFFGWYDHNITVNLYAEYKPESVNAYAEPVTLTLEPNGAQGEPVVKNYLKGYAAPLPEDLFARPGYTFNGWNTAADGTGTAYTSTCILAGNTTLYAQWSKNGGGSGEGGGGESTTYYILHYESNGGTKYKDERYVKNTVVQLDKVPVREGYQFTGWYADKELTERITSIKMTSDKTVYAGWRKATVPDMLNGDDHFAYVIGYTDGTVRPNANISRSEVAAIFFRLLKPEVRDGNLTSSNTFTDVNEGMWCNKSISTMAALNIVKGRSAEYFDPDAPITRAEFAAICARFDTGMTEGDSNFTDISGHWAKAEIERAASLGWIMGYTDGTFRPDNYITRAEAMTMINRVLCRIPEDEDDLLPGMNVWPDNQPSAWYYLAVQEATNSHDFQYKGEIYEHWIILTADPDWTRYQ